MKTIHSNAQRGAFRWLLATSTLFWILGLGLFLGLETATFVFPNPVYAAPCAGGMTYGDAPSGYGQACESIVGGLRIGATAPVSPTWSYPCTTTHANCNPSDNFLNPLTPIDLTKSQYLWSVPVSNTTGSTAFLAGWIDFDNDGSFEANERITTTVPSGTTFVTLTWSIPITATPSITTYVRLRLTSQAAGTADPTTAYGNGEVEDYEVATVNNAACTAGSTFYYIQGSVQGGSGTGSIQQYNVATGIASLVFTPPTRTTPSGNIQNINGIASDPKNSNIYFQDSSDSAGVARGIYGYNINSGTFFTLTTNASGSPLNISPVTNGWTTAAGAFANGKYYVGVDGGDSGNIYEITLNSAGTALAGAPARVVITSPGAGCGAGDTCNNYGDILVDGNRMWVALWQSSPERQILDVWDINSGTRLSRFLSTATGFAIQLARDGNGQIWAITSNNGRVYTVTNGVPQNFTANPIRTIGSVVHDAGECLPSATTAVTLSSFNARAADSIQTSPPGQVTLSWVTASELNTAGFNIYRSERADGPFVRINQELIPGSSDALVGGKYQYLDANIVPGTTYYYQIEDVEFSGGSTSHAPIFVTVPAAP